MANERCVAILTGQGDIEYTVMTKEQWEAGQATGDMNDACMNMVTQELLDKYPSDEEHCTLVEFSSMNGQKFFKYLQENNITVVNVFQGYIY